MTTDAYTDTRVQLHTVTEWLLAGPQYATSGTIRLRAGGASIATVAAPDVSLSQAGLTVDGSTHPLTGTVQQLADAAGLPCRRPAVDYHDPVPGGPDTDLDPTPAAVGDVLKAFASGAAALAAFSGETPVVWPEHFDMAIRANDVNYGVSPGDAFCDRPYAYVGPDSHPADDFWNAPFGAFLRFDPQARSATSMILTFFQTGRDLAAR